MIGAFPPILLQAVLAAVVLSGFRPSGFDSAAAAPRTVAVTSIVEHPALDAVLEGLREGLAAAGHRDGSDLTILHESAEGNPATAARIAARFVAIRPALVVAISTPSAQAMVAATSDIPIVFSAVTDPLAARLVVSLQEPGGNVTGVSDMGSMSDNLTLVKELTPGLRRLGFLFSPDEANSLASLDALKRVAETDGIEIIEAPARSPAEVEGAVRSLVGRADAIFAPTDNTVVQAFEAAASVAIEARLPLYAADTENVARGALAALGVDYRQVGTMTAELVTRILKGEPPGKIPVVFSPHVELHLNRAVAAAIGVPLTAAAVKRAARIVDQVPR